MEAKILSAVVLVKLLRKMLQSPKVSRALLLLGGMSLSHLQVTITVLGVLTTRRFPSKGTSVLQKFCLVMTGFPARRASVL